MQPNYQDKGINFYCCDCQKLMTEKPDNYYQLSLIDSPYGIGESIKCNNRPKLSQVYHTSDWDKESLSAEYFRELFRVSKNQIVWGANHFISKIPFDSSCWIVWDKHREKQDFADCELAWTSFLSSVKKFSFAWDGFRQGYKGDKEQRIHPTQKPVALYRWLLKNYAKPGDRILDTHGGSMSSAIACALDGFEMDICEIDREYFDMAVKRFKESTCQMKLF